MRNGGPTTHTGYRPRVEVGCRRDHGMSTRRGLDDFLLHIFDDRFKQRVQPWHSEVIVAMKHAG